MDLTPDELDLIEQVLQNQMLIFEDADQRGDDPSGFVVDGLELSVEEYGKMVTRFLQKLHGVDEVAVCPDCGEEGEGRGHYGCQYPSNDPDIEGLEDPMERER